MQMDESRRIATAVIEWFRASRVAQKKHAAASEWTVLAGVVLLVRSTDDQDEAGVRVLACGTGTKCLGRCDLDADGLVVNDCHAEVVARRALLRYLYCEVLYHNADSSIFRRDTVSGKLRLKPLHELHLFISEAPCGDAAIYPLQDTVVDTLVANRTQRETTTTTTTTTEEEEAEEEKEKEEAVKRSDLRLTGAKQKRRAENDDAATKDKRFAQAVGIARVKSGRSDLPVDKQTMSMSCSDKINVWNAVGIQGSLLLQWYAPLYFSSIVVAQDPTSRSSASQLHAMERALLRGCVPSGQDVSLRVLPLSDVTSCSRFPLARDAGKTASALSLNWTQHEPHWTPSSEVSGNKSRKKSWMTSFFESSDIEVLMAASGFKEGAKKASKMDQIAKQRVASRLSKWSLFRAYETVRQATINPKRDATSEQEPRPYHDEKVVVLGLEKRGDRERIKLALRDWVGVPALFKRFSPFVEEV